MPKDVKGEKVEGYKVSDQMRGWMKSAVMLKKMSEMLQMRKVKLEQDTMSLMQAAQGLQQQMPKVHTKDIQGMEF